MPAANYPNRSIVFFRFVNIKKKNLHYVKYTHICYRKSFVIRGMTFFILVPDIKIYLQIYVLKIHKL